MKSCGNLGTSHSRHLQNNHCVLLRTRLSIWSTLMIPTSHHLTPSEHFQEPLYLVVKTMVVAFLSIVLYFLVGFYRNLITSFWRFADELPRILPRKALQSLVPKSSPDAQEVATDPSVATMDLCRLPTKAEPEKLSKTAT